MADSFSEDDARRIFARAAERQGTGDAPPDGLSLDELKSIGQASGIDPAHVSAAAAELRANAPTSGSSRFLGVPTSVAETRVLDVPLTDAVWEALVDDLRDTFGQTGVATEIGRVREWTAFQSSGRDGVRVTARPRAGGTELAAEHSLRVNVQSMKVMGACFAVLTAVLTVVGGLIATPAAWLFGPMVGLCLAVALGIPVWMLRRQAQFSERSFGPLLDRAELASRRDAEAPPEEPDVEPDRTAPRLDADPGDTPTPRRRRRTR